MQTLSPGDFNHGHAGHTLGRMVAIVIYPLQVCPDSAKVQLNSGIIERRYRHWDEALLHFERARTIEPGYCEPGYWIGVTLVNLPGQLEHAIKVDCVANLTSLSS